MSEDLTQKIPGSFEERALEEFAGLNARFSFFEARLNAFDEHLTSLEEKVGARLRETRPIWEGVQQRLTEIEKSLDKLSRHFKVFVNDAFDLRARVGKLEDERATREG